MFKTLSRYEPYLRSLLRIIAAFGFLQHGTQKVFGWLGGMGGGAPAEAGSLFWVAGVIETVGGLFILLGLFTRPVAFILAGQMAVAYFMVHSPMNFWPVLNMGEIAALYCFVFLWLSAAGPGPLSLDAAVRKTD